MKLRLLGATFAIGMAGCAQLSIASAQNDAAVVTIRDGYVVVSQDPVFGRPSTNQDGTSSVTWRLGTEGATFAPDGITVDARIKDLPKLVKAEAKRDATKKLNDIEAAKKAKCEPAKDRRTFTCVFPKDAPLGFYSYTIRVVLNGVLYEHDPLIVPVPRAPR